jgi:hypothetical protein
VDRLGRQAAGSRAAVAVGQDGDEAGRAEAITVAGWDGAESEDDAGMVARGMEALWRGGGATAWRYGGGR